MTDRDGNEPRTRRGLLDGDGMIVAPGAYDCVTAMLIERAGFDAVYMSGGSTSAARFGYPDYGLTTMTEVAEAAAQIAGAVSIPTIVDADTGYGNELNVVRTVRGLERRGVAAIQLEDQTFPKRCGHLDGKQVTSLDAYLRKLDAALHARTDPNVAIIARTDARSVLGFEEAMARMEAALAAGADIAFPEAPETLEEVEAIPRMLSGPALLNIARGGKSPLVSLDQAAALGYRVAIVPGLLLATAIGACEDALDELTTTREHPVPPRDHTVAEVFGLVGSAAWDEIRARYALEQEAS